MNTDNNHLIDPEMYAKLLGKTKEEYEEVPNDLALEANLELMGKKETIVGKESTGSINTWAKEKRIQKEYLRKVSRSQKNKMSFP